MESVHVEILDEGLPSLPLGRAQLLEGLIDFCPVSVASDRCLASPILTC